MKVLHASEARKNLYRLIDQVADFSDPTYVKGKRNSIVMVPADEWEDIQETTYLNSIPGYADSIKAIIEENDFIAAEDLPDEFAELRDMGKNRV